MKININYIDKNILNSHLFNFEIRWKNSCKKDIFVICPTLKIHKLRCFRIQIN